MLFRRKRRSRTTMPVTDDIIRQFSESKYPIDIFCKYNNIRQKDLETALHNKMQAFRDKAKAKANSETADFVEIKNYKAKSLSNETDNDDIFDIFDDSTDCYDSFKIDKDEESVVSPIINETVTSGSATVNEVFSQSMKIRIGKATIEVPVNISQNNLRNLLGVLAAI